MWLDVPASKRDDNDDHYQTDSERVEAVVKEWRAHHPTPSWKGLARALYGMGELRALRRLYGKYLTGMSCDLMSLQLLFWKGCVFSLDCVWIIPVHLYMNKNKNIFEKMSVYVGFSPPPTYFLHTLLGLTCLVYNSH